jgi:ethanolamine ammonia-lyase large subunit
MSVRRNSARLDVSPTASPRLQRDQTKDAPSALHRLAFEGARDGNGDVIIEIPRRDRLDDDLDKRFQRNESELFHRRMHGSVYFAPGDISTVR